MRGVCPECGAEIEVSDDIMEGEVITCSECGAELEVVGITDDTVEFAPAGVEEEDWGE